MGASRRSYKLSIMWKYGGGTNTEKIKYLFEVLTWLFKDKYIRKYFILDNFTIPYNKWFKCKYGYHHFVYDSEDNLHRCKNCGKSFNNNDYKLFERIRKIQKLRKNGSTKNK